MDESRSGVDSIPVLGIEKLSKNVVLGTGYLIFSVIRMQGLRAGQLCGCEQLSSSSSGNFWGFRTLVSAVRYKTHVCGGLLYVVICSVLISTDTVRSDGRYTVVRRMAKLMRIRK